MHNAWLRGLGIYLALMVISPWAWGHPLINSSFSAFQYGVTHALIGIDHIALWLAAGAALSFYSSKQANWLSPLLLISFFSGGLIDLPLNAFSQAFLMTICIVLLGIIFLFIRHKPPTGFFLLLLLAVILLGHQHFLLGIFSPSLLQFLLGGMLSGGFYLVLSYAIFSYVQDAKKQTPLWALAGFLLGVGLTLLFTLD